MAFLPSVPTKLAYLTLNESAPRPEKSINDYTDAKISERLDYVRQTRNRKVSPRTEMFLRLYEGELEKALVVKDETQKLEVSKQLHLYDQFIQASAFLCYNPSAAQIELQKNTLQLRKLEYYCRYGDYWANEMKTLKAGAKANEIPNRQIFEKYWTKIGETIKAERKISPNPSDETPTLLVVYATCNALRISPQHMLWAIERYAERNEYMHSTVNEYIQQGLWTDLAVLVYNDEQDLDFVVPEDLSEDKQHMKITIAEIKASYFDIDEGDENNPRTWTVTKRGKDLKGQFRSDIEKQMKDKLQAKEKEIELMKKHIRQKELKVEKEEELLVKALRGMKRKSGCELDGWATQERAKRKREVEQLLGIQTGIDNMEGKLDEKYNEREKLVKSVKDWALKDEQEHGP